MPNYFQKNKATAAPAAATHNPVADATTHPLGFFKDWKLKTAKSQARLDVEIAGVDAVKKEALAVVELVATLHGTECRLAEMASHATTVAVLADEVLTAQQVTSTTLAANRFVGSIINIESRQEMVESIEQLVAEGKVSQQDVAALHATAGDLHAQIEASIDDTYNATANMVTSTFQKATVCNDHVAKR